MRIRGEKRAKRRAKRGVQGPGEGSCPSLHLAELSQLSVDCARRNSEQLCRQRLVAAGVAEGLPDEPALDLVQRRADRKREAARNGLGALPEIFGEVVDA